MSNFIPEMPTFTKKKHYNILDGLRGVAAIVVVCFHIFEAYATSHLDQQINHGYLAVDFFFLLSGFVVGYAYDERWKTMGVFTFLKQRFIRLHPMVVLGAIFGGAMFYFQVCPPEIWDVEKVTMIGLLFAVILNIFLIPASVDMEIRGLGEMYPLNGPSWSLFFEYIGNILYALVIRKLSTPLLAGLVLLSGSALSVYAMTKGDICVGFSFTGIEFLGGSLRLIFSFSAGLLLIRLFKPLKIKGAFWICSAIIISALAVPRIGGADALWMNGIYEMLCFAIVFPAVIFLGASGETTYNFSKKICGFLGDISYPLYIIHYPLIYLYYGWVKNEKLSFVDSLHGAILLLLGSIILAYICLRWYDIPVRKFLSNRWIKSAKPQSVK